MIAISEINAIYEMIETAISSESDRTPADQPVACVPEGELSHWLREAKGKTRSASAF